MKTVKFKQWMCNVEIANYSNNDRIAIQLVETSTGELVATATVNVINIDLEPQEVVIKSYSENEGMYDTLLNAGIISPMKRQVQTGWHLCNICDYLDYLNYKKDEKH